jgi:hypothetical protein
VPKPEGVEANLQDDHVGDRRFAGGYAALVICTPGETSALSLIPASAAHDGPRLVQARSSLITSEQSDYVFEKRKARKLADEQRRDIIAELRRLAMNLDSEAVVTPEQFGRMLELAAAHDILLRDLPEVRDPFLRRDRSGCH